MVHHSDILENNVEEEIKKEVREACLKEEVKETEIVKIEKPVFN